MPLVIVAVWSDAASGKPAPPTGRVLYIKEGALWRAQLAEPERAERLIDVPVDPMLITGMVASGDGQLVLLDLGKNAAWIDLSSSSSSSSSEADLRGRPKPDHSMSVRSGGAAGTFVYLPCSGGARLSHRGGTVACAARGGGMAVFRMRPPAGALLLAVDPSRAGLADADGARVVASEDDLLWAAPVARLDRRTNVAPHAPRRALSIAPDGRRAVGRYPEARGEEDEEGLYGFQLDGRATPRKLMTGMPIAWSGDSIWVAIATDDSACALRAVGGESKCWDGYRPLAVDGDGAFLLLGRPAEGGKGGSIDLFLGRIAGVRAEKPVALVREVAAAALVP